MIRNASCTLAFLVVLFATPAFAGTLATTPDVFNGWQGSAPFTNYYLDGLGNPTVPSGLYGTIEYAVFAPGEFLATFGAGTGYTPTPGEYVYAYQGFVNSGASLSLSSISVTLANSGDNIGTFTFGSSNLSGGVVGDAALDDYLVPFNSANWDFNGVNPGEATVGLVFSSPNVPMMSSASVQDGGSIGVANVPSPSDSNINPGIPEPSTLALSFSALAAFTLYRVSRKAKRSPMK